MTPKVYLETTIPSYLTARASRDLVVAAHQALTVERWNRCRGRFRLFVSALVLQEASRMEGPIVEEVRKVREENAARFNYDVDAIFEDLKKIERESGWTTVSLEPKCVLNGGAQRR